MINCVDCKIKLNNYYFCSKCYNKICLKCMHKHYEEHKTNPILTDETEIKKLRERVKHLESEKECFIERIKRAEKHEKFLNEQIEYLTEFNKKN